MRPGSSIRFSFRATTGFKIPYPLGYLDRSGLTDPRTLDLLYDHPVSGNPCWGHSPDSGQGLELVSGLVGTATSHSVLGPSD